MRHCVLRGLPFGDQLWGQSSAVRLGLESMTRPRGGPKKSFDDILRSRSAAPKCRPAGDTYRRSRSPSGTLGTRRVVTKPCRDSNSIVADSELKSQCWILVRISELITV
jgi:hypothetical protein